MSTAFYLETDGQTESVNSVLKQSLRVFVNYKQDNWADLFFIAEFEANSNQNNSKGILLFFATKRYYSRSSLEPPSPMKNFYYLQQKKKLSLQIALFKRLINYVNI